MKAENSFDWAAVEHRLVLQTMVMTGSDLCARSVDISAVIDI